VSASAAEVVPGRSGVVIGATAVEVVPVGSVVPSVVEDEIVVVIGPGGLEVLEVAVDEVVVLNTRGERDT
jgi:hypothetical protein